MGRCISTIWKHPVKSLLSERIRSGGDAICSSSGSTGYARGRQGPDLDGTTFKNLTVLPEPQRVLSLAWHPGGKCLAVVSTEHDIHVWY